MHESRTPRAFVSFGQCSEKMVFERAIPSSSTQNVSTQYLRRITELICQEENVFKSDYVSFRLSFKSSLFALSLFAFLIISICVMPFRVIPICVMLFRVMPIYVMPLCIMPFRIMPICVMPFHVMPLCVMPFYVMPICVKPFTTH